MSADHELQAAKDTTFPDTPMGRWVKYHYRLQCSPFVLALHEAQDIQASRIDILRRYKRVEGCFYTIAHKLQHSCIREVKHLQKTIYDRAALERENVTDPVQLEKARQQYSYRSLNLAECASVKQTHTGETQFLQFKPLTYYLKKKEQISNE